ncbi:MAG: pantoate--beta-alanine ligase [Phycisphaerae bacterium]
MKIVHTIQEVRSAVTSARRAGKCIGFVPTMGNLHEGHFSLIDAAREGCDFVVVSVFVNPTQFGPGEDYESYPRTLDADAVGCRDRGVDVVFAPSAAEMYPEGFATTVHVSGVSEILCGASRPGHFDGVCTVVAKLFGIVMPDRAYFGAKDYQQSVVIRRMAMDLNWPVEIEVCPTVREPDGLAMSSRNQYLSPSARQQAGGLQAALQAAADRLRVGDGAGKAEATLHEQIAARVPDGQIDYAVVRDAETLGPVTEQTRSALLALAVKLDGARLIDNIVVDA